MNIPPELSKLAHNKAALGGLGAAAVLGLYIKHRSGKTSLSSGSTASTGSTAPAAASGGVADGSSGSTTYPNTYGTDLATALGNIDSQYAGQVSQFNDQLGAVQSSLTTLTAAGAGVGTGVASATPRYITVNKGETQKDIDSAAGISYATLTKLNPELAVKGAKVKAGQKIRVS